jgi:hypothetical protein
MRVVFATCSAVPNGWPDDHPAAELLQADRRPWDDANVDWASYDRVVVRSVYDYPSRVDDFLEWCHRVGAQRLRNSPALLAFNADKTISRNCGRPQCQPSTSGQQNRHRA